MNECDHRIGVEMNECDNGIQCDDDIHSLPLRISNKNPVLSLSISTSTGLCTYHLLPRGSTPGTPLRNCFS